MNLEYVRIITSNGQKDWLQQVFNFNESHKSYEEIVSVLRDIPKIIVITADGKKNEPNLRFFEIFFKINLPELRI